MSLLLLLGFIPLLFFSIFLCWDWTVQGVGTSGNGRFTCVFSLATLMYLGGQFSLRE